MIPAQEFAYNAGVLLGVFSLFSGTFGIVCAVAGRRRSDVKLEKISHQLLWNSLLNFAIAAIVVINFK